MEKRILVAFVLSFGVLYAFRALYTPTSSPPGGSETAQQAPATSVPASTSPPPQVATENSVTTSEIVPEGDIRAEKPEEFVVDSALYRATVSNAGGVLKSYVLKTYKDAQGRPIELIDAAGASQLGWPLKLATGDAALDEALERANFAVKRDSQKLEMQFAANGIYARKSLEFDPSKYEFQLNSTVTKDRTAIPHSVVWQSGFGDQSVAHDPSRKNAVHEAGADFERTNLGGIEEPVEVVTTRAGVEDQYFLSMFLLPVAGPAKIEKREYKQGETAISSLYVSTPADSGKPLRIYVGPKDEGALQRSDPRLSAVIDYGFFAFIARPLIFALLWLHGYIGNFGWAIIILTVAINFVLFPLRLKQQVSMQKMQKIQPQMRTLQDKYKKLKASDPRRAQIQAEMMGLYKEHGVNPMGGCLPLLLQIPFFAAIWTMLSVSIELRQAPWILWIKDLSQRDPYYIIPVLMAVSMVVMQKMTPTTVDPSQAKIMMAMPLVFAVMFLQAQSGLTLYWLTSNVVGIVQQYFMNKYWTPATDASSSRSPRREPRTQ